MKPSFIQATEEMQTVAREAYAVGAHPSKSGNASLVVDAKADDLPRLQDGKVFPLVGKPLSEIRNQLFLITASSQRLSRVGDADTVDKLGVVAGLAKVAEDGNSVQQVWGFNNNTGERLTSEYETHLRVQEAIKTGGVLHAHPLHLNALLYAGLLSKDNINQLLWQDAIEGFAYLPNGGAVLPPMVPGSHAIGELTAEHFAQGKDIVGWDLHGWVAADSKGLDAAWNKMETAEHTAHTRILALQARVAANLIEGTRDTRTRLVDTELITELLAAFKIGSPQVLEELKQNRASRP